MVLAAALVSHVGLAAATIWTPETIGQKGRSLSGSAPIARPPDGGEFGYLTAEAAPYVSARSVVHYVTTGLDAPPLNDDNANGLPDYVEQVGAAADRSLEHYAMQGFLAPVPDSAGPNANVDIYLKRLDPGFYGLALPHTLAAGGGFVVASSRLDQSPERTEGNLQVTIAHELFHIIQFSCTPDGEIPRWVAEGSASAMELLVYPEILDFVTLSHLSSWLEQTWRPLYDEGFSCDHCYGGAWWWYLLLKLKGNILPEYLGRLHGYQQQGVPIQFGLQPLDEILKKRRYGSLYNVFTAFSIALYRAGINPAPAYALRASSRVRTTRVWTVGGLSTHYIPIRVPSRAPAVVVVALSGGGTKPDVTLIVGGPDGRKIKPSTFQRGRGFIFTPRFRNQRERNNVVLIITSGRKVGTQYLVSYGT